MRNSPRLVTSALLRATLLAGLLGGCVYYNGMYNANRLARSARKAEREGRTFDANNLWGQVATKAESVIVRHPTSKYAEEAAVLQGLAFARLGQCQQALGPLGRAAMAKIQPDLAEDAYLAAGRCQVALGDLDAGDAAFIPVLESKDPARRREARLQHARLLRQVGRPQEALVALEGMNDQAVEVERLLALAGTGLAPRALTLADSLVARGDTSKPWDSVVVALGRQDPAAASDLVDRMLRLPRRPAETRARWLVEDGIRLVGSDTARAASRFRQTISLGGSGRAAGQARLQLVQLDLRRSERPQDLAPLARALGDLSRRYEFVASEAARLSATIAGVLAAAGLTTDAPLGDLRLFLAGEAARDSLAAPRLAGGIFHRILLEWPTSPYTPKAVLAAQQLDSTWADSARSLLEERYADSPYLALIRGEATPAYRHLEDSLGAFAAALAPSVRPAGDRPGVPGAADVDKPQPLPQPAPGTRVLEP